MDPKHIRGGFPRNITQTLIHKHTHKCVYVCISGPAAKINSYGQNVFVCECVCVCVRVCVCKFPLNKDITF